MYLDRTPERPRPRTSPSAIRLELRRRNLGEVSSRPTSPPAAPCRATPAALAFATSTSFWAPRILPVLGGRHGAGVGREWPRTRREACLTSIVELDGAICEPRLQGAIGDPARGHPRLGGREDAHGRPNLAKTDRVKPAALVCPITDRQRRPRRRAARRSTHRAGSSAASSTEVLRGFSSCGDRSASVVGRPTTGSTAASNAAAALRDRHVRPRRHARRLRRPRRQACSAKVGSVEVDERAHAQRCGSTWRTSSAATRSSGRRATSPTTTS